MSDIDFNELDKAVNSLADNKDKGKILSPIDKPPKNSGRFMDMVHSSSDMKKDDNKGLMTTSTTNITPIDDNIKIEPQEPQTFVADEKNNDKDSTNNPSADEKPEADHKETAVYDNKKDNDKKTTPFLDNTKVEKRPLGGASSELSTEPPVEPIILPPELDKNLVAIESGESPELAKETTDTQEPINDKDDKQPIDKDQKKEVAQLLASATSGSIPDQYKRGNRSHELHSPHPLFDTEHYKDNSTTAVNHSKSPVANFFQWVFIVLGLLLLGGSIGVTIFVFINQS